jgi:16S rRNA (guanine966-N2)-methyltransferase
MLRSVSLPSRGAEEVPSDGAHSRAIVIAMRITGGMHRSRALRAPRGTATRPTSDRVREALFSILESQGRVEGARVLDLYAGTGALALDALSRGAARATLVESARDALVALRANVSALDLGALATVVAAPVERSTAAVAAAGPFDLVLADPPYADLADAARALAAIVAAGALAEGALVVLEHAAPDAPPDIPDLETTSTRRYGDTALTFYCPA